MPRPNVSINRTGVAAKPKSSNPFKAWIESRRERKDKLQEQASRMITNKIAENENTIADQLNSVDFLHSRLPKSILETKSRENQDCCDLEYATRGIIQTLVKNPQTIKMDIRAIDEKLLTLVLLFKQAVEQGDVRAAYAAKGALVRGMKEIRTRIPQDQPELAKQFVEQNARYLDQWITLVGIAQVADRTKQNVENMRERYETTCNDIEKEIDDLLESIRSDPELGQAYEDILNNDSPEERSRWTPTQRKVHQLMIDARLKRVNHRLNNTLLQQQEGILSAKEAQLETLYTKLASLPIVADPDLLNKYKEAIDQMFEELAANDVEIDEALQSLDDFEGRIAQLESAPGAIRAREVAAEQAGELLDEMQKRQEFQSGIAAKENAERMRRLGIRSEEEQNEMRRQIEEEMAREEEALYEASQESQQLYN